MRLDRRNLFDELGPHLPRFDFACTMWTLIQRDDDRLVELLRRLAKCPRMPWLATPFLLQLRVDLQLVTPAKRRCLPLLLTFQFFKPGL